jgi:hypothetical protein
MMRRADNGLVLGWLQAVVLAVVCLLAGLRTAWLRCVRKFRRTAGGQHGRSPRTPTSLGVVLAQELLSGVSVHLTRLSLLATW